MSPGHPVRQVVVSVDTDEPAALSDLASRLAEAGLDVSAVHDAIAVITGTINSDAVGLLRQIPGVLDVELERTVRVAPPDSDVQ